MFYLVSVRNDWDGGGYFAEFESREEAEQEYAQQSEPGRSNLVYLVEGTLQASNDDDFQPEL